ncbi:MAG: hypothetical protein ACRDHK_09445, partial [Actinomycetota bacterium]
EYQDALLGLRGHPEFELVGHFHPAAPDVEKFWRNAGVRTLDTFQQVLREAAVYVTDNSSTLYEFTSLDRPVVVLNSRHYRRDVEHGPRFWRHAYVGPQVWSPERLELAIMTQLQEPKAYHARRTAATRELYPHRGRATATAIQWLETL